ncbi:hypothetical protein CTA2_9042 [Colletotrichum tanaceti]|uniref:DUF7872 domain-containing protein n=1 Tax=Colletotrichum tanaceti TaxID=1306861 RepID=A0A4U6XAI3_9PEZI|nr:hypothetical protein CTA2_9042 [Colletotrichum tanaceti]TKW52681.1 hypothetical protein CTA1_4983 [Colletotrichum tanaceti]
MLLQSLAACAVLSLCGVNAAPLSLETPGRGFESGLVLQKPGADCEAGELSNATWVEKGLDAFLENASHQYTRYPTNNVQALAAYLGAPNFLCGVNAWCNAGQPCSPVTLPGWYALMAIQGWNNYINNLNLALTYMATILSLKLGAIVNDLWPVKQDNISPWKMAIGWMNGIINAFPTTWLFGAVYGGIASGVQGVGIVAGGMLVVPTGASQFIRWSDIANQMGSEIDNYKKAIGAYAKAVMDAPIDDPKWGINKVLRGGRFLARDNNITLDDIDRWMYQTIATNAMGAIMQARNVYVIRTFNLTLCYPTPYAIMCELQPNNKYTEHRLQRKKKDRAENELAKKLIETHGLTQEQVLKGPAECFDANDYQQLTNPWEALTETGIQEGAIEKCNFNLNVCNFDAAEHYGYASHDEHVDRWCAEQGIEWA